MFTIVARYHDPIEAHIARGLLASEGIEAHVGDDQIALANWEWRLATGGTKLRVPNAQAERAREILCALEAGAYRMHDDEAGAELQPADYESTSSRIAWLALMLLHLPLPWRRRAHRDDEAVRIL
jgi:hypothetical protein